MTIENEVVGKYLMIKKDVHNTLKYKKFVKLLLLFVKEKKYS